MIEINDTEHLKQMSVAERIGIIEFILSSIKNEINRNTTELQNTTKPQTKHFKVRKFSLGADVRVDREDMYAQRGL